MLGKKLYFFGGKGGVGKTTVSSAFSLLLAKAGKKVLIISTDPAHSLSDLFETNVGPEVREVLPNLFATEIDPGKEVSTYVESALNAVERAVSPEVFSQIKEVFHAVEHTPGVEEAVTVDTLSRKILDNLRGFDCFVVDTAPTGHTLAMLRTVERVGRWMEELIERKMRAESLKEMAGTETGGHGTLRILKERRERLTGFARLVFSEDTLFVPVMNPERLSILETERLIENLEHMGVGVTHLVVNKVLPEETDCEFLRKRKTQEREYLELIGKRFRNLRVLTLKMKPTDLKGIGDLEKVAEELEAEL
ncbi:MAG: TRC40/GET3/ArsA family transport-energizing ATPase [Aquificota bacterium]|nr:TRC40/GET3/ArsA family transport-energizing ATPase [Aquificota bacterium]